MSLEAVAEHATFSVIDLETTGLDAAVDGILEIAAIRLERGVETARWQTLVTPGPGVSLSEESQAIHGIRSEDLVDAPPLAIALAEFRRFIAGTTLVAHNAPFDVAFLNQAANRLGEPAFSEPVVDTLEMAREVFPDHRSHKLEALCRVLGREAERFHRAEEDAGHLAAIFPTLWQMWREKRAWQRSQFPHIGQVARRYEATTRLVEALQQEIGEMRRTLVLYLDEHPDVRLPLGDGTALIRSARETYEYDPATLLPLLEGWGLGEKFTKLDRQRLDRWLSAGRFTPDQRAAILATRTPCKGTLRLLRQALEPGPCNAQEARP